MKLLGIIPTAILDYYDGVQIFSARDAEGGDYVGVFVGIVDKTDRYLVTAARPERMQQFLEGKLDLLTLLLESPGGEWYLTLSDGSGGDELLLRPQPGPLTDHDEFLPLPDLFLPGGPYETLAELQEPEPPMTAAPTDRPRRLIENWLPINEISVEGIREGGALAGHPPVNQLHVWWARRPLVASRSAVAASLLNADADHSAFIRAIGSTETVVAERREMDAVKASGQWSNVAFSNKRAFTHNLSTAEADWFQKNLAVPNPTVLDVTAGGGSIPFEAGRLGLNTIANELNPVANIILHATCQWPQKYGSQLHDEYRQVKDRFADRVKELLSAAYPEAEPLAERDIPEGLSFDPIPGKKISRIVRHQRYVWAYLWCRTIHCPTCRGEIPLSPNWRLSSKGDGISLLPDAAAGLCQFAIVTQSSDQSVGTVKGGIAVCPYPGCASSTPKGYLSREAQAGRMGHRLYCVIYRDQYWTLNKNGKENARPKTDRVFAAARPVDGDMQPIQSRLTQLQPHWDAANILPDETKTPGDDDRPITYGMSPWRQMFSPRQQLAHGSCVQAFQELVDADRAAGELTEIRKIAWCYVALALDKLIDYNSLLSTWIPSDGRVGHTFADKSFAMVWSYAEMAVTIQGLGLDWALADVFNCISHLNQMAGHAQPGQSEYNNLESSPQTELLDATSPQELLNRPAAAPTSLISMAAAQELNLSAASVDAIIFDPPYHNNVNYAELSDFFYVWLKRTVGYVYPELCQPYLTDKVNEAIASPARFKEAAAARGQSAARLATADYEGKMREIFRECRRVIKPDGIMTVMFTHKSVAAWDALAIGLIEAGFAITRTWPVKTESEHILAMKGKAAARSTILLVCRPTEPNPAPQPWHEVERLIEQAVREDIPQLVSYDLKPVDLYLAAFGPALQVISEHWGTERETANPLRPGKDEFLVTPTDAMQVARREVSRHRAAQLSEHFIQVTEPLTRFYILALDGAGADTMEYDEARLLGNSTGLNLDRRDIPGIMQKKGDKVTLKSAADRLAEDKIGPQRPADTPLDQAHTAIAIAARQDSGAAENWLNTQGIDRHGHQFKGTLEALHQVLKPGHPDLSPTANLYQKLYGSEPPRQTVMTGLAQS